MVYAIAAYTITIGTLALYGIMIRYRQRVATAALARAAGSRPRDAHGGFNVGAALLAPFWMWAHGMRAPGAVEAEMECRLGERHRRFPGRFRRCFGVGVCVAMTRLIRRPLATITCLNKVIFQSFTSLIRVTGGETSRFDDAVDAEVTEVLA